MGKVGHRARKLLQVRPPIAPASQAVQGPLVSRPFPSQGEPDLVPSLVPRFSEIP